MHQFLTLVFLIFSYTNIMASHGSHLTSFAPEESIHSQILMIKSSSRKGLSGSTYLESIGFAKEEAKLRHHIHLEEKANKAIFEFIKQVTKEDKSIRFCKALQKLDQLKIEQIESWFYLKTQAQHIFLQIPKSKELVHQYLEKTISQESPFLKTSPRSPSPTSTARSLSDPEIDTALPKMIDESLKQSLLKRYITNLGFPNCEKDLTQLYSHKDFHKVNLLLTQIINKIKEDLKERANPDDTYIKIMAFLRISERMKDLRKEMTKMSLIFFRK